MYVCLHVVIGLTPVRRSPPAVSPILDRWIRQRARDLTLRKVDTQRASKVVNNFRDQLLDFLKNNQEKPYFRQAKVLNSGSYFELVKVCLCVACNKRIGLRLGRVGSTGKDGEC